MTDHQTPFGYTLLSATTICSAFWSFALHDIQYVGTIAFMLFQVCLVCWAVLGLRKLVTRIRRAFTYAPRDLADFVAGKGKPKRPEPVIPHNLKDPKTGRFISRKAAMRAALEHAVGVK